MKGNRMLAGIVLAAGESSRMGRPKQLLDWHGQPLIAAQAQALLDGGCETVVVVLGAHADAVRPAIPGRVGIHVATNRDWSSGRASSIRVGATATPDHADALVIASVDQPTSAAVVRRLAAALHADAPANIVVPRFEGRNGHPPIFRRELLPELRGVSEEQEGLREVRRRHVDCTSFIELSDPIVTLNLNTPELYQAALTMTRLGE